MRGARIAIGRGSARLSTSISISRDRYLAAATFGEFLATADANRDLWQALSRRAKASAEFIDRAEAVPGHWHLLVLVEDWCGDAVNTVPSIAALAEAAGNLDLRVVGRDGNPDLMDAHLTNGTRSIPVVILLDSEFEEIGWWGPRPAELQTWVRSEGQRLAKADRYREVRRWYARDRARTTLDELVSMLEAGGSAVRAA